MNWRTILTAPALLALSVAIAASPEPNDVGEPKPLLVGEDSYGAARFTVEGTSVMGLYPGAIKRIRLTIVNPDRSSLRIDQLSGRVVASSRRSCSNSNLRVLEYSGHLPVRVRANGRTTLPGTLSVMMRGNATPACAGTRFTIGLTAVGARTGR